MATSSGSLEYWRKFFRSAKSDIFGVIEQAVVVAASDHPQEFRSRRDLMVERFYAVLLPRCFGCDRVDIGRAATAAAAADDSVKRETEKESKVDSSSDAPEDLNRAASNYSYNETDALTEEIQEEMDIAGEVLRIKAVLERVPVEEERVLFESLRQLQALQLSVEVLKTTEIGKTVNILRKHNSKQIRRLVRTLIESWKVVVDRWVNTTGVSNTDNTSHSLNPSMVDDDGLPSASLDDGTETTTSVEFTKSSFSGMDDDDDDENFRTVGKERPPQYLIPEGEIGGEEPRQPLVMEGRAPTRRQEQRFAIPLEKGNLRREERIMRVSKQQDPSLMQEKPELTIGRNSKSAVSDSGPGRPPKFPTTRKAGNEMNSQRQQEVAMIQRKPLMVPQDVKPNNSEENSVRARLEAAKRKFHHQQPEIAKRQRTMQATDLQEIPKQTHNGVQPAMKSRNIIRNSAYGRQQFS